MIQLNRSVFRASKNNGHAEFVKNGIANVWDLTVSSWSMLGNKNVEFRLQRNVILAHKARR